MQHRNALLCVGSREFYSLSRLACSKATGLIRSSSGTNCLKNGKNSAMGFSRTNERMVAESFGKQACHENAIGIALVHREAGSFGKTTQAPHFYCFERAQEKTHVRPIKRLATRLTACRRVPQSSPQRWEQRLIPLSSENTRGTPGWCLDPNNLAISTSDSRGRPFMPYVEPPIPSALA